MAKVSVYLNFDRNTEEAFNYYKQVFGTEFQAPIARMGEVPPQEGVPAISEEDKNLVMHVALPIFGEFVLMGSDAPESIGFKKIVMGNNVFINLEPDTRSEADSLFAALSLEGTVDMPMQEMFWGDYFGSCIDKFGVCWMFNCSSKE